MNRHKNDEDTKTQQGNNQYLAAYQFHLEVLRFVDALEWFVIFLPAPDVGFVERHIVITSKTLRRIIMSHQS